MLGPIYHPEGSSNFQYLSLLLVATVSYHEKKNSLLWYFHLNRIYIPVHELENTDLKSPLKE